MTINFSPTFPHPREAAKLWRSFREFISVNARQEAPWVSPSSRKRSRFPTHPPPDIWATWHAARCVGASISRPAGKGKIAQGRLHFVEGSRRRTTGWIFREWTEREIVDRFNEFSPIELWRILESLS